MRWIVCALILTASLTAEEPKKVPLPLTLKVVDKTDPHDLVGNMTPEEMRKEIAQAIADGRPPEPTKVKLELEFKNVGSKNLTFYVGGDRSELDLDLRGDGAVVAVVKKAFTREFRAGKAVELAPGKTYILKVERLAFGKRDEEKAAWLTEYGAHSLVAKFRTAISPAPQGFPASNNEAVVTIVAESIALQPKKAE